MEINKNETIGDCIYIDCICNDFDHVSRLFYNTDIKDYETFYLEYKTLPWNSKFYSGSKLKKFCFYFKNIWHAIKGRPNSYAVCSEWSKKDAEKIKDFIDYCLTMQRIRDASHPN